MTRESVLARLRQRRAAGEALIVAGVGSGLTAAAVGRLGVMVRAARRVDPETIDTVAAFRRLRTGRLA